MAESKSGHVKVHSMLTVVSSAPTEPAKLHKFTRLDTAMGIHTLHVIFYYKSNPFKEGKMTRDLENLRISLGQLLCMYPKVTGRLSRGSDGNWFIKCNDAGVRTLRAKVGFSLDEWLRSATADDERYLTVWEDLGNDPLIWSPFRIQINDFDCGGLAIGISCPHMHADFTSVTQFIKSWSEVHRCESVTTPPVFDLPEFITQSSSQTELHEFYASKTKAETSSDKLSTATFKFSDSIIKKCLLQVHEICPDATPFDFLVALFWSSIMRLKEPNSDQKTFSMQICIDLRNPSNRDRNNPIPYGYFGNAQHFSQISVHAEELVSGDRLSHVSKLVHQHVTSIEDEPWSSKGWFGTCKDENGKHEEPFRMYGPILTCVSMEQMINPKTDESLMYTAMFKKDEKPAFVSYHIGNVEGEGLVMVMPSPEGGSGRTVLVRLLDKYATMLHEDQAILALEPVVLTSGKK